MLIQIKTHLSVSYTFAIPYDVDGGIMILLYWSNFLLGKIFEFFYEGLINLFLLSKE